MEVTWDIRFFGGLAERFPRVCRALGNLETKVLRDRIGDAAIEAPAYVCGLARSGTTILLETFAAHPATATHRYRDFPFPHFPWMWNRYLDRAANRPAEPKERAHRDRILITPDSPEAMEEILWMDYFPNAHDAAQSAVLGADCANDAFESFYRDHIRKLLALRGGTRYLAKGNYNVTRLAYLRRIFPDARFVVAVREPVAHVASLSKQHRLFAEAERRDPAVADYMRRSGHFEFGLGRTPVNTGSAETARSIAELWRREEEARGTARLWASVYGFLHRQLESDPTLKDACMIVRYEDLCAHPKETLLAIAEHLRLEDADGLVGDKAESIAPPDYYRPDFPEAELAAIREETAAVAALYGYETEPIR